MPLNHSTAKATMTKSNLDPCSSLPSEAQPHARAFLAAAKPYTANEVARVLTNLSLGVNFMGCGKFHCASSYAKAVVGKNAGLGGNGPELARLTIPKLAELLAAERKRLVALRNRRQEAEVRRKLEMDERVAYRKQRALNADRWEALVEHGLLSRLGDGEPDFPSQAELTALVDATLAAKAAKG
jgi:hypothetical protein